MSLADDITECADCAQARRPERGNAILWLSGYVLSVVACLAAVLSGRGINSFSKPLPAARGDIRLYWDVVRRMQEGENYYAAMHAELHRQGYPTASVFNWRTPPVLWLMAHLSGPTDGTTIILCAAAALIAAGFLMQKQELGLATAYAGGLFMLGAVLPCFVSDVCILPVQWAAVCVGLSLCSFAWMRTRLGVVLGILAACCSELTLGYVVLMAATSAWSRRWRELRLWAVGLLAFSIGFLWHARMVCQTVGSGEVVNVGAWLQFCGLPFLVATAQMNCWLLPLPAWLAAIYLPTGLLGLARWNSPAGRRCGVFAFSYCLLFLCVGQPFNQYWGLLLAPPLAWGAARSPGVLRDLWQSAQFSLAGALSSRRAPLGN